MDQIVVASGILRGTEPGAYVRRLPSKRTSKLEKPYRQKVKRDAAKGVSPTSKCCITLTVDAQVGRFALVHDRSTSTFLIARRVHGLGGTISSR